jgi:hypothetical protein
MPQLPSSPEGFPRKFFIFQTISGLFPEQKTARNPNRCAPIFFINGPNTAPNPRIQGKTPPVIA